MILTNVHGYGSITSKPQKNAKRKSNNIQYINVNRQTPVLSAIGERVFLSTQLSQMEYHSPGYISDQANHHTSRLDHDCVHFRSVQRLALKPQTCSKQFGSRNRKIFVEIRSPVGREQGGHETGFRDGDSSRNGFQHLS